MMYVSEASWLGVITPVTTKPKSVVLLHRSSFRLAACGAASKVDEQRKTSHTYSTCKRFEVYSCSEISKYVQGEGTAEMEKVK